MFDNEGDLAVVPDLCGEFHALVGSWPICDWKDLRGLPENGLYCFYEKGESCDEHALDGRRIVRVGINKVNGNFAPRLRTHYRGDSSIYRTHVVRAMAHRDGMNDGQVRQLKSSTLGTKHPELKRLVTNYFKDMFQFRYEKINDRDTRVNLEERAIGTVAACSVCKPSTIWLGNLSINPSVKSAGIWNDQHTRSKKRLRPSDLESLRALSSE